MSTNQKPKDSHKEKRQRIANIKILLSQKSGLTTAQQVCNAYLDTFKNEIPLPSMSRYLSSSDFERDSTGYKVAIKNEHAKKLQTLSTLLSDANAQIINEHDILFISLSNDFSTTIAHYLENHPTISDYVLGIIPYKKSLMIFCRTGYKKLIEDTFNTLLFK